MAKPIQQQVIDYYQTRESRWGYRWLLGGTKHFGYYPDQKNSISMKQAMRNMERQMGKALDLPTGSRILDAGCGMGRVATHLAQEFGYAIEGIDLLDFNVSEAKRYAKDQGVDTVNFQVGDYTKLPFPDNSFDGVYTMETLVHAPDHAASLVEFRRVLKPGGRLVLFEYSIDPLESIEPKAAAAIDAVIEGSVMPSLRQFVHGSFPAILKGFKDVKVRGITAYMVPMLRRFYQLGLVGYEILKHLPLDQKRYINALAGVELYRWRKYFRYNIITANKPSSKA